MRRLAPAKREKLMAVLEDYRRQHVYANINVIARASECAPLEVERELRIIDDAGRLEIVTISCAFSLTSKPVYTDCYRLTAGPLSIRRKS